jgi:hypothetical protein
MEKLAGGKHFLFIFEDVLYLDENQRYIKHSSSVYVQFKSWLVD